MKTKTIDKVAYEAPTCETLQIKNEGILCQSGNVTIQSLLYDEDELSC